MFSVPVIAMLFNLARHTWHPVVFEYYPLPGGAPMLRFKSRMHHTSGFPDRESAIANAKTGLTERIPDATFDLDGDIPWDGEGVPALVCLAVRDGAKINLLLDRLQGATAP